MLLKQVNVCQTIKKLFINVDANILLDQDFVQGFTKEYLKKYDLDSKHIVFELSEKHL